jgi:predicted transcriptional regulator
MSLTIRIPDQILRELKEYQKRFKPHMSQNALIVEAIIAYTALERQKQGEPAGEEVTS